jgi:hypothetical protein
MYRGVFARAAGGMRPLEAGGGAVIADSQAWASMGREGCRRRRAVRVTLSFC